MLIPIDEGVETGIETCLETFSLLCRVGAHDKGAKGWGEGEGIKQRDAHGDGHGETELGIEGTRDTADEADGHEDSHEDKSGGDQSRSDAVHGSDRSVISPLIAFVELGLDCLDNYDSIVDHCADDQYEGKKREHVE